MLNPRAVVPEAREEIKADDSAEDVKKKFGDSKGIVTSQADAGCGGPDGGGRAAGRGGQGGRPNFKFSDLDKDGDGKVTKDEAPEQMQGFFDRIDTNSDGTIDAKEFAAMQARRRAREAGGGGPPGE